MKYNVQTKLPEYETWFPAIDMDESKVHPIIKKFDTKELAEEWAGKNVGKHCVWRVSEDDTEE